MKGRCKTVHAVEVQLEVCRHVKVGEDPVRFGPRGNWQVVFRRPCSTEDYEQLNYRYTIRLPAVLHLETHDAGINQPYR